jgi:acyl-CoA thioesterase FadM
MTAEPAALPAPTIDTADPDHGRDVFAVTTQVLDDDIAPLLAGEADPTGPGMGRHLTFDRILRRCGQAWMRFLLEPGPEVFAEQVIAPHVTVDYHHEVGTGPLRVTVEVTRVGTSSFGLRLVVSQREIRCATVQVVLVRFDYDTQQPLPLDDAQRRFLVGRSVAGC